MLLFVRVCVCEPIVKKLAIPSIRRKKYVNVYITSHGWSGTAIGLDSRILITVYYIIFFLFLLLFFFFFFFLLFFLLLLLFIIFFFVVGVGVGRKRMGGRHRLSCVLDQ